jgi:Tol biopolymer transport system component/DNA-binding winged helix-turn-helix (wHTH) protein
MGEQAFQILRMLLETPGQLVRREEMRSKLWAHDTFVDFDHGLNSAVQRLRDCLSDSAGKPRWIETIPRRGYRFVGQVEWLDEGRLAEVVTQTTRQSPDQDSANASLALATQERTHWSRKLSWRIPLMCVTLLAAMVAARLAFPTVREPKVVRFRKLTNTPASKGCPYSAGSLVYFNQEEDSRAPRLLMQLSASGGEPLPIPNPLGESAIVDISKDGSKLLIAKDNGTLQGDLWVLPVPGGSPQRVGNLTAQDAAFSSDASKIAYTNGNSLFEARTDGSEVRNIVTASGFLDSPAWSPDDKRLRYRQAPAFSHNGQYWEVSKDGNPRPLFSGIGSLCCGAWTSDGRYFVYLSRREGEEGFWAVREKTGWLRASGKPVLMAANSLSVGCGLPNRAGNQIFLSGEQPQAELIRYDASSKLFLPFLGGPAAEYLSFSRDGQWVAYATYPEGELWRSRVDGTQRLKLTGQIRVLKTEWSPDGKRISFVAKQPSVALYVIPADGGTPQRLPTGDSPVVDHSWSPDGKSMVIGEWVGNTAPVLRVLDLKTGQMSVVPGSEGILGPVWSPDGRYVAALKVEGPNRGSMLYEVGARRWTSLPIDRPRAWSHDSQHIYYKGLVAGEGVVMRFRVADRKIEKVVSLKGIRRVTGSLGQWIGLDPSDAPLLLRNTGNEQVYALDWDAP